MSGNNNKCDYITIIPYCPHCAAIYRNKIVVRKLCFWSENKFDHTVTEASLKQFLLHVKIYGASVYPDFPELGCYAIDGDKTFSPAGKTGVSEIHYNGEVIWCRN